MKAYLILFLFLIKTNGLKTWIPRTGINSTVNWDAQDVPKTCDNLFFPLDSDVAVYWNVMDLSISSLSLPRMGEIIFPTNLNLRFRDKNKCPAARDMKYERAGVKGWLDPDNWKSDDQSEWLPHSQRVPCAGEKIVFPSDDTIAVQLPSILVPVSAINFGTTEIEDWSDFLKSELGYQFFKGPEDLRNFPWRTDSGCSDKKKCVCGRSAYTIRDRQYRDTNPEIFEEAVCLYAMPKCKPVKCYFSVVPEGHCCGICGAVLKLEDETEDGLNLLDLKNKVEEELRESELESDIKTYVGRTKDGNIQIVVIAENSDATISSQTLANAIEGKLTVQNFGRITSRHSGLPFKKYLFNSISGIVFGTFFAVSFLIISLFYFYIVLPKKKLSAGNRRLVFSRLGNASADDSYQNLEIDPDASQGERLPQAFDNPIYSENFSLCSSEISGIKDKEAKGEESKTPEKSGTTEYHNLVYKDLEKSDKLDIFSENKNIEKVEEFSEIDL